MWFFLVDKNFVFSSRLDWSGFTIPCKSSEGPVLLSRTYPLIYRIEANISAFLESFFF